MPFKILGVRIENRIGDMSDFCEFRISEVNYIKVARLKGKQLNIPLYHTSYGTFAPLLTLQDLTNVLQPRGFRQLDNSVLANVSRILKEEKKPWGIEVTFKDKTMINVATKSRKR